MIKENHLISNIFNIGQTVKNKLTNKEILILGLLYSVKKELYEKVYISKNRYSRAWINFEEKKKDNFEIKNNTTIINNKVLKYYSLKETIYFNYKGRIYKGLIEDVYFEIYVGYDQKIKENMLYKIIYKPLNSLKNKRVIINEKELIENKTMAIKEFTKKTIENVSLFEEEKINKEMFEINTDLGIGQHLDIYGRKANILQLNYSLKHQRIIQGYLSYINFNTSNWRMLDKKNHIVKESNLYQQYFNLEILSIEQNVFFKFEDVLYSGKIKDVIINIKEDETKKGELYLTIFYKIQFKATGRSIHRSILLTEKEFSFKKEETLKKYMDEFLKEIE